VTRHTVARNDAKRRISAGEDEAETEIRPRDNFDYLSPLDTRYYGDDRSVYDALHPYLSEAAVIRYQIKVEQAIIASLEAAGIAPHGISARTPAAVY